MSEAFDPRPVLLVHGLWNAKLWLTPLAWRLRRAGFEVGGFGYPSIVGGAEAAVEVRAVHDLRLQVRGRRIRRDALRRAGGGVERKQLSSFRLQGFAHRVHAVEHDEIGARLAKGGGLAVALRPALGRASARRATPEIARLVPVLAAPSGPVASHEFSGRPRLSSTPCLTARANAQSAAISG